MSSVSCLRSYAFWSRSERKPVEEFSTAISIDKGGGKAKRT